MTKPTIPALPDGHRRYFSHGVAYLDPNDFGDTGYFLFPVMTLFFRRVVVYSPYPDRYEEVRASGQYPMPSWDTVEDLVTNRHPAISVVAFPTYRRNPRVRDLARETFIDSVIIKRDRRKEHANTILAQLPHAALDSLSLPTKLPPRYQAALDNKVAFGPLGAPPGDGDVNLRLPQQWEAIWPKLDSKQRLLLLAKYDKENDRSVTANVGVNRYHCSHDAIVPYSIGNRFLDCASLLHGPIQVDEAVRILELVLRQVSDTKDTFSAKNIVRFRSIDRQHLVKLLDALFQRLRTVRADEREGAALEWAKKLELQIRFPADVLLTFLELLLATKLSHDATLLALAASLERIAGSRDPFVIERKALAALDRLPGMRRLGYLFARMRMGFG